MAQSPIRAMADLNELRVDVAARCRELACHGMALAGAGNVSVRTDEHVLVTRSGLRLDSAAPEDITVVTLAGRVIEGARPSSEVGLHLGIYERSAARAVVHTHGRSSVAVGLVCDAMPLVHYNLLRLGGRLPTVPYHLFGSEELADAVGTAVAAGFGTVLMRNHGAVSSARSLAEAVEHACLLEWLCDVYLAASSLGPPALLDDDDLAAVAAQSQRLTYGG
ncbi:class II aldolase [Mycolicibacterium madagascariense]|uniref:Class II aldolase n=1 Tax=Mycolicibacterium madagascariense TaxID=212765 RepID=A0A7I7X9F1_9MYCO|nr:class II aldolase/adducin family protein [Mycolicibacterium madagascariense]MCV7013376.1 class II aldolase/adducin family protein [Mycolicibacterium madagascariense]BBZ25905.1 class II aldolase [Mycolicibacterium madagascariense]